MNFTLCMVACHTSDPGPDRPLPPRPTQSPSGEPSVGALALIGDVNHSSGGRHLLSEPSVGKYFLSASPGSAAIALVSPNILEQCDRWKNTERKGTMISVEISVRVHWETRWEVLIKIRMLCCLFKRKWINLLWDRWGVPLVCSMASNDG